MFKQFLEGEYLTAAEVLDTQQEMLLAKKNVVGVAVGHKITDEKETGDVSITIFVDHKLPPEMVIEDDLVPEAVEKIKTDVVESGILFAGDLNTEQNTLEFDEEVGVEMLRSRSRPIEGGMSIGHYRITAGTYATAVYDARSFPGIPPKYYALSNNHVLANSNLANIGDPILQPGPYDGGTLPRDFVARLSRYVPIYFDGRCNYVDAAIAEGPFHILDREIYWIGYVKGISTVNVGSYVQKTGRTTNYTTGRVIAVNATVRVNYGGGNVATMCRQIVTSNMSAPGDSGSLLCDMNENAVGLLFAGSSRVTIHNDIRYVIALLGIRLD